MANCMGERIKDLRIEAGLTLDELAERIGMKKANLSKYENGLIENMKRSTIEKLAYIFNVSEPYILGYTNERYPLENEISKLDPEDRELIYGIVQTLLRKEKYHR